jgi:antitoxin component YwqK of YwqJK toxin-antitoxin module
MKKISYILAMIFFISDCSADARVLAQIKSKASARAKNSASKLKKSKIKSRTENCIPKQAKPKENTKPKEIVTSEKLDIRNDLAYLPNEDKPFTGKYEEHHSNKKKYLEIAYKDGKKNGLLVMWDEYEHKIGQLSFINGNQQDN